LFFNDVWSTSMITNFVWGNFVAAVLIASPCAKPTPMIRS
jgi:hypothetical protein